MCPADFCHIADLCDSGSLRYGTWWLMLNLILSYLQSTRRVPVVNTSLIVWIWSRAYLLVLLGLSVTVAFFNNNSAGYAMLYASRSTIFASGLQNVQTESFHCAAIDAFRSSHGRLWTQQYTDVTSVKPSGSATTLSPSRQSCANDTWDYWAVLPEFQTVFLSK